MTENGTGRNSIGGEPTGFIDDTGGRKARDMASLGVLPTGAEDVIGRFLAEAGEVDPGLVREQQSVMLRPGDVLLNRFEVTALLGFGGMGAVYRVKDRILGEDRALKIMLPSLLRSDTARERFTSEVRISQQLNHDGIVRVHDLNDDRERGLQFFTMEYVEGRTLHRLLSESGGKLPAAQALDITRQLCDALEYAHQYTVHRDLKPQNIMVRPDGRIKMLDFGLAKVMSPGRLTKSSMALGTAYYQAPEQSVHLGEVDRRADVYSLGVILYQMLTGEMPVGSFKQPSSLRPEIPRKLDAIVTRCLEPKKENRYPSVAALRDALDKGEKRPSKMVWAAAAVLLAVLVFMGGWYYRSREYAPPDSQGSSTPQRVYTERVSVPPVATAPSAPPKELPDRANAAPMQASAKPDATEVEKEPLSVPAVEEVQQKAPAIPAVLEAGATRTFADMKFVWIPPGEFMMGSPYDEKGRYDNEIPQHKRIMNEEFWLGKYEVTQEQWRKVMGDNPSYFKGETLPVEQVSWDDCQVFVAKLNRLGQGIFRLPSEAEWEYACRAGTGTRYYWGNDLACEQIKDYAWYNDGSNVKTHPGGQKRPNAWNLYDMAGNVWEWCEDDYHESYHGAPRDGRAWVDSPRNTYKVPRGGSWETTALNCRATDRGHNPSDTRRNNRGVRLVRIP